ncbi:MAG: hypothetical protein ACK5NY_01525 [Burkholderiaceae bacterium]|jgi:hypothetical protein
MPRKLSKAGGARAMIAPPELKEKIGEGKPLWEPYPFQAKILEDPSFEILLGGVKGSGKSALSRAWLLKGNPDRPVVTVDGKKIMANESYIHHPRYTALILRKNQQDLRDWIEHSKELFLPLGAVYYTNPITIKWPSGAIFYTGHLADESSWGKYLGVEIHRLVIEEIVLIENSETYQKLRTCVRSSHKTIRPQILATCNPYGPGVGWIRDWWARDEFGNDVPSGEQRTITVTDQLSGKQYKTTRSWYFGKWGDNPTQHTDEYKGQMLAGNAQHLVRAYVYGEWDAVSGGYLPHFRPSGPLVGEPENARHVLPATEVKPWDRVVIGADWGIKHNAAAVRLRKEIDGRIRVDRSFAEPGLSTYSFGELIAGLVKDDLKQLDQPVDVFLSPDCWARESEVESEAKRIMKGIARVVGPERVVLQDEDPIDQGVLVEPGRILLRKANNARIAGWTLLSELMIWQQAPGAGEVRGFSYEEAERVWRTQGEEAWRKYRKAWLAAMPAPKPAFIISDHGSNQALVRALQKMQHGPKGDGDIDKKHWDGADILDALRYGLLSSKLDVTEVTDQMLVRMRLMDIEKRPPTNEMEFMSNWLFSMKVKGMEKREELGGGWVDRLAMVGRRGKFLR